MGNRGILHDSQKRLGKARWKHKAWIICVLKHKDWHREVMTPNNYTELFFLDDAVALSAGHRPCALCRREDFDAYRTAAGFNGTAKEMDDAIHAARAVPRVFGQRRHSEQISSLPDGTVIDHQGTASLVFGDTLRPITAGGYLTAIPRPRNGLCEVLTPEPSVEALRNGFVPVMHPSL